jgi:hypothetical protein
VQVEAVDVFAVGVIVLADVLDAVGELGKQ